MPNMDNTRGGDGKKPLALVFDGRKIASDGSGFLSLTDMWKAAGSPNGKDPSRWGRFPTTQEVARVLKHNCKLSTVLFSKPGKGGGTWASPELTIAYAKYLSPEFHAWALRE